jgi:hypothetical protein
MTTRFSVHSIAVSVDAMSLPIEASLLKSPALGFRLTPSMGQPELPKVRVGASALVPILLFIVVFVALVLPQKAGRRPLHACADLNMNF